MIRHIENKCSPRSDADRSVVVNLYPFQQTVAAGADRATAIENIDIVGPALIRSAAKNHAYVTVLTQPEQYQAVIAALR
jgi:phosphoribosylaminoimidazolecarboxamide formyltransferase/IMP cyclohydrolase